MSKFLKVMKMRDSWQEMFRTFFYHRIPLITTVLMMFLFLMPINSVHGNYFKPMIGMICVYYWSQKRPYMFGFISAFLVGLMQDIYSSSPLGINSLMMMFIVLITMQQPRYFQTTSFGMGWFIFAIIALVLNVIKWLLLSVYYKNIFPLSESLPGYLATIMFYPLIAYICGGIQNILPQEHINE